MWLMWLMWLMRLMAGQLFQRLAAAIAGATAHSWAIAGERE